MRSRCSLWLLLASGFAAPPMAAAEVLAGPAEVLADVPTDLSVTVYRAPDRASGSIDLDRLNGFALVSETRAVHLPAGESRLRFEGVADGIEPASAIITGLEDGALEKNRDAALLSPSALMAAAAGKPVQLLRTNPHTGNTERLPGTILSDAEGGVVFQTAQGIEGLRCSGLSESFSFTAATNLAAHPTLSVLVRSREPKTVVATLSYLARGFDWAADYIATVSADGKTMDLGAWVTLANGNGVGFPSAHIQVIAGRVNRESGEVEPIDAGGPILARCWPRGSTSDSAGFLQIDLASPLGAGSLRGRVAFAPMAAAALVETVVAAHRVEQEQLGDLKLYRVPDRTTVASRQSKQVRLLDRSAIPIAAVYGADLSSDGDAAWAPASKLLRTKNDSQSHLGLPLPSGTVAVFAMQAGERLLEGESGMRDLAVDEEVEIGLGDSPNVQVTSVLEQTMKYSAASRVEISNAGATEIEFELRLRLPAGARVTWADHPVGTKNGRPIFRLTIPANSSATVHYRTRRAAG
jgi:hypothetical protein